LRFYRNRIKNKIFIFDFLIRNKVHKSKQRFFEKHSDLSNEDYKLEMLYAQKIIHGKLHRIRSNLTKILWSMVVLIGVCILSVIYLIFK